jgi:ferrous iron transport protein A
LKIGRKIQEQRNGAWQMTLDQIAVGKEVKIIKVGGEGQLRIRLLDMGLIPQTVVRVQKAAPMGDPIEIHLRGYELTLRKKDAARIEVAEV